MVTQIIVIGAGASGMMAAGRAAELGAPVLSLEKTDGPGKKILISGKTRCNVTNTRELPDFIDMFGRNGRFLHHAFHRFFRDDLLEFLLNYGVATKVERGGRIFPASGDARDVVTALKNYLDDGHVRLQSNCRVSRILVNQRGNVTGVETADGNLPAHAVVLAAGGASFPATGSGGDSYRLAESAGHTVTKLRPALVPLTVEEIELARSMRGVNLRNVRLTAFQIPAGKIDLNLIPGVDYGRGTGRRARLPVIESLQGEMQFTHFGLGGPILLRMSLGIVTAMEKGPVSVSIDLKPALSVPQLRLRLQRDFDTFPKRSYFNLLKGLLPPKMIRPFVQLTGIPEDKPGSQIGSNERERLLRLLKSLCFNIKSPLPLTTAMVTAGGVSLDEIDPRTMASKITTGLYFCGEVLDIDAETGGFNLQAAFSTGRLAGESAGAFASGTI